MQAAKLWGILNLLVPPPIISQIQKNIWRKKSVVKAIPSNDWVEVPAKRNVGKNEGTKIAIGQVSNFPKRVAQR